MLMILEYNLTMYNQEIRDWAAHGADTAKTLSSINRMRLDFARFFPATLAFEDAR